VLRWTTSRFAQRGLASPRLDAEILVAHALGISRVQLYVQFDRPLEVTELGAMRALVKRRQDGESVAYIIGKKEFFGIELDVDTRVLVPRPDTETLVDEALARIGALAQTSRAADGASRPVRVADVGTGSGAVAIAIAKALEKTAGKAQGKTAAKTDDHTDDQAADKEAEPAHPALEIVASDLSADALAVARDNAARHGVSVTLVEGDLDQPLRALAPFDVIAANLPYIPSDDIAGLAPEVRAEPRQALDGGADGLVLVRRLVAAAPAVLGARGALILEIGAGQAAATAALLAAAGFVDVRVRRDLGEIDRVVSGVKP
jgi:release factor glutamine methyltransferase